MQEDLQRMELEAREVDTQGKGDSRHTHSRDPSLSAWTRPNNHSQTSGNAAGAYAYTDSTQSRPGSQDTMSAAPSFSPFPKVKGDNVPPSDDEKEEILWSARKHVLSSQNVSMQITWARDVLNWAEISMEADIRENPDKPRSSTPRIEHELRLDAINIITYLAGQDHPQALYLRAKWLEFGKFDNRVDKRGAYEGYRRAADLGNARSEYRMGMLYEQSNDMSKAKEHYYRGMSLKDSAALYRMGMMSLLGQLGEAKDYPTGLERIRAAADGADEDAPQGAFVYGMLVGRDLPDIQVPDNMLPNNPTTAMMYIEKSAYLGFAKAQLKMGQAYELCQFGCEFNPSYSLHYYGLAAKQGQAEAALGVSRWFLFGYEGVFKKNEELAYSYASQAAAQKLSTGEFAMGYYNEIGIHVGKSVTEARKWYQLAADHGNKDATNRLESLNQDKTLSKTDHETTTLTRIKSQHGSQRGKRPDRFKQRDQMPTLSEGSGPATPVNDSFQAAKAARSPPGGPSPRASPHPSPGLRPTVVHDHAQFPDPSRASVVATGPGDGRGGAFNIRLDNGPPGRPHSAAPYPDDGYTAPLNVERSRSAAPYPEDDVQGRGRGRPPPHGPGPHSDRPGSAFGINPNLQGGRRPIPQSQSVGNLHPANHPDPRGRISSAGHSGSGPRRGHSPGPGPGPESPTGGHHPRDAQGRPISGQPYPPGNGPNNRMPPPGPNQGGRPAGRPDGRPDALPQHPTPDRNSRVPPNAQGVHGSPGGPGPHGRGADRFNSLPQDPRPNRAPTEPVRPPTSGSGAGPAPQRVSTAPQAPPPPQMQSPPSKPSPAPTQSSAASTATSASKPGKGPATFEDMGIPQGKQDGDCVSSISICLGSNPADSTFSRSSCKFNLQTAQFSLQGIGERREERRRETQDGIHWMPHYIMESFHTTCCFKRPGLFV